MEQVKITRTHHPPPLEQQSPVSTLEGPTRDTNPESVATQGEWSIFFLKDAWKEIFLARVANNYLDAQISILIICLI